jgi:serine-type D-Ala-D-Ala carboxypeptidase/endopeptidase (penicillin-binding protein 4)
MKQVNYWLKNLAVFTLMTVAWTNVAAANEASKSSEYLTQDFEPIEIVVPPPESSSSTGVCPAFLESEIDQIVESDTYSKGKWGILIQSLDGRTTFYSRNADKGLIPASNLKIFTAAAALQTLDPEAPIGSKPVREWVNTALLHSDNNYAETLFRTLGGSKVAKENLSDLGVNPNSYRMVDGSGLSRQNLATPRALVATLRGMYSSRNRDLFFASLPTAGVSGTLKNRMRNTAVTGSVHAKTGTLQGVRALSGYMEHPEYGTIVFSIIVNQSSQSGTTLVTGVDRIVLKMSNLTRCETASK